VLHLVHHIAGAVGGHEERGDAFLAGRRIADGKDDRHFGNAPVGNELLGAVEPPAAIGPLGPRAQGRSVRSGVRLGQGEGAGGAARHQIGQEPRPLLGTAIGQDAGHDQAVVDRHDSRKRTVPGSDSISARA
jgi:hypothetical protein